MKIRRYQLRRVITAVTLVLVLCVIAVVREIGLSLTALLVALIGVGVALIAGLVLLPLGLVLHDALWPDERNSDDEE
jgi:hypothetical protein